MVLPLVLIKVPLLFPLVLLVFHPALLLVLHSAPFRVLLPLLKVLLLVLLLVSFLAPHFLLFSLLVPCHGSTQTVSPLSSTPLSFVSAPLHSISLLLPAQVNISLHPSGLS